MATQIFLSNDPSDQSGYKLAYVGTRSPNASGTSTSVATTPTTAGVSTIAMLFGDKTIAKWITPPISTAVTLAATCGISIYSSESAAAALGNVDLQLFRWTIAAGTIFGAFITTTINTHSVVGTTGVRKFVTIAPTSTAFNASDRIVILGNVNPAEANMGGSQSLGFYFNGLTEDADGDSYVVFSEDIVVTSLQGAAFARGPSIQHLEQLRMNMSALQNFAGQMVSPDAKLSRVLDALAAHRDTQGA